MEEQVLVRTEQVPYCKRVACMQRFPLRSSQTEQLFPLEGILSLSLNSTFAIAGWKYSYPSLWWITGFTRQKLFGNFLTGEETFRPIMLIFWLFFLFMIIPLPFCWLQLFHKLYRTYLLSNQKERKFSSPSWLLCFWDHLLPNSYNSLSHLCLVASVIFYTKIQISSQFLDNIPFFHIGFRFLAPVFKAVPFCPVASLVSLFFPLFYFLRLLPI